MYNQVVSYYVSLALLPLAQICYICKLQVQTQHSKQIFCIIIQRGGSGGGGGRDGPGVTPKLHKEGKNVTRVCARMGCVLELNSYTEYPPTPLQNLYIRPCQLLS